MALKYELSTSGVFPSCKPAHTLTFVWSFSVSDAEGHHQSVQMCCSGLGSGVQVFQLWCTSWGLAGVVGCCNFPQPSSETLDVIFCVKACWAAWLLFMGHVKIFKHVQSERLWRKVLIFFWFIATFWHTILKFLHFMGIFIRTQPIVIVMKITAFNTLNSAL